MNSEKMEHPSSIADLEIMYKQNPDEAFRLAVRAFEIAVERWNDERVRLKEACDRIIGDFLGSSDVWDTFAIEECELAASSSIADLILALRKQNQSI